MKTKLMKTVCKVIALSVTVGTMLASNGMVVNAQPKVMKDGTTFDAEYYAQRYADVVAVYGTEEAALFQHYTDYGRAENREAVKTPSTKTFDPVYYAKQNPDVVAAYGTGNNNLYQHYLQFGKKEGRKPTANASSATVSSTPVPAQETTAVKQEETATEQKEATPEIAAPAPEQNATPAQANAISDEEAQKIFIDFVNNITSRVPAAAVQFFDADSNGTIDKNERGQLLIWASVNYTQNGEIHILDMGRAIHDGTFKLPSSYYYAG